MLTSGYTTHIYIYMNYEKLCQAITPAAESNALSLVAKAEAIADRYMLAFHPFSKCHQIYNSASFLNNWN